LSNNFTSTKPKTKDVEALVFTSSWQKIVCPFILKKTKLVEKN
jgi:hypothetical protein